MYVYARAYACKTNFVMFLSFSDNKTDEQSARERKDAKEVTRQVDKKFDISLLYQKYTTTSST